MSNRQEQKAQMRPARTTNGRRNVLTVQGLTDTDQFHYHWFNDVGDNINTRLEEGYVFVDKAGKMVGDKTAESARGTDSLMKKGVGLGTTAYLMRIPIDIYMQYKEEERQNNVKALEDEIQRRVREKGAYGSIDVTNKR